MLAPFTPSGASAREWVSIGPDGGRVFALAPDPSDPDTLYAGLRAALVFRSDDAGATWSPARAGLPGGDVLTLTVDAAAPATLYAGMFARFGGAPVSKSTDRGATWEPASTGIAGHESHVTQTPAGTLLATGAGDLPAQLPGIFRSDDGAATWTQVFEGIVDDENAVVESLGTIVVDPRAATTLLACSNLPGLVRSTGGGSEWTRQTEPFGAGKRCDLLAAGPLPAGRLYAFVGTQLWTSDDGGAGWTAATGVLPATPTGFLATGSVLYAGTFTQGGFVSSNEGASWTPLGATLRGPNVFLDVAGRLYVGTDRGLHVSDDGGASAVASSDGLSGTEVADVAVHRDLPSRLVAAADGLLWRSVDGGAHWARTGPDDISVRTLLVDPRRHDRLYAGVFLLGLYRSLDGGETWWRVTGLPAGTVIDLAAEAHVRTADSAESDSLVFFNFPVPAPVYSLMLAGLTTPAVHRSLDSGRTWAALPSPPLDGVEAIAVRPIPSSDPPPAVLYLVGSADDGGGIARWTESSNAWEVLGEEHDIRGYSVAIAADEPDVVWVGAHDGVWVSFDGGDTWERRSTGLPARQVPAIAADGDHVVAFTAAGVFETTDAGASWHEASGLLPPGIERIEANLSLLPGRFGAVFTGTQGAGVARLDACERSVLTNARFRGRHLTSEISRLTGRVLLELPAGTAIDPVRDGIALRLEAADGPKFDIATDDGRWQARRPGQWRFSAKPEGSDGMIKQIRVRRLPDRPDTLEVRFVIRGNSILTHAFDLPALLRVLVRDGDGQGHCGEVPIDETA